MAILCLISWENDIVLCLSCLENFHSFLPNIKTLWQRTKKSSVQRKKEAPHKILKKKQLFYIWLKVYQRQAQYWALCATFSSVQDLCDQSDLLPQPGAWEGALARDIQRQYSSRSSPLQQSVSGRGLWVTANLHFNSQIQIKAKVVIKEKMKMRIKVIPHSRKRRD